VPHLVFEISQNVLSVQPFEEQLMLGNLHRFVIL
jgi:hypothetical protein